MSVVSQLLAVVIVLWVNDVSVNAVNRPVVLKFIGVGYHLLEGNPEGDPRLGHSDPGFRITHRILLQQKSTVSERPHRVLSTRPGGIRGTLELQLIPANNILLRKERLSKESSDCGAPQRFWQLRFGELLVLSKQ